MRRLPVTYKLCLYKIENAHNAPGPGIPAAPIYSQFILYVSRQVYTQPINDVSNAMCNQGV